MPDAPKIEQENQQQSIAEVQQDLIDEFEFLDDWMDRYRHIIDLGQRLEDFPEEWMTDEFKVRGCQSQVWLVPEHTKTAESFSMRLPTPPSCPA